MTEVRAGRTGRDAEGWSVSWMLPSGRGFCSVMWPFFSWCDLHQNYHTALSVCLIVLGCIRLEGFFTELTDLRFTLGQRELVQYYKILCILCRATPKALSWVLKVDGLFEFSVYASLLWQG